MTDKTHAGSNDFKSLVVSYDDANGGYHVAASVNLPGNTNEFYVALEPATLPEYPMLWFEATSAGKNYINHGTAKAVSLEKKYYHSTVSLATVGDVVGANGKFYTVSANSLYASSDALNWSQVKSGIKSLIVSVDDYGMLWAVSQDSNLVKSSDMTDWTTVQRVPENFPDSAAYIMTYPLATNASLTRSVIAGLGSDSLSASVWTILTGDTVWTKVDVPADKNLRLPASASLSLIRYDGAVYGLGQGLDGFRQSNDNGITWYLCKSYVEDYSSWNRYMQLPAALKGYASDFTVTTDKRGYIWIMTDNGCAWRGAITRLINLIK